jgi:hypothetical protein
MKLGYTPSEVTAMFDRLRPEAAAFWNEPRFLTLPFKVEEFSDEYGSEGSTAVTEFTGLKPGDILQVLFGDDDKVGDDWPQFIMFNTFPLPYMYEDEVRSVLIHEMAHAATGNKDGLFADEATNGHGPLWETNARDFGAAPTPSIHIRKFNELPFTIELPAGERNLPPTFNYPVD